MSRYPLSSSPICPLFSFPTSFHFLFPIHYLFSTPHSPSDSPSDSLSALLSHFRSSPFLPLTTHSVLPHITCSTSFLTLFCSSHPSAHPFPTFYPSSPSSLHPPSPRFMHPCSYVIQGVQQEVFEHLAGLATSSRVSSSATATGSTPELSNIDNSISLLASVWVWVQVRLVTVSSLVGHMRDAIVFN